MLKFVNFSIKFLIVFFIVLLIFGFSTLWYFSIGLPDYKKLSNYQPPISSRVYSEDRKLIAEYALEKRLFIPYDSIPEIVINSFLSAEDKNFFRHPGVDAKGPIPAVHGHLQLHRETSDTAGDRGKIRCPRQGPGDTGGDAVLAGKIGHAGQRTSWFGKAGPGANQISRSTAIDHG